MFLSDINENMLFRIVKLTKGKEIGRRLADMGFTSGEEGVVVHNGIFNGPLHVKIRGYSILLRRSEAAGIEVKKIESAETGDSL